MSNYTKTTNFASKDNLSPGNPLKIVKGTEIDTEFNNIQTAVGTKTDNASANITGGTIVGITDLAVADGGTGASTAAGALNNLLPSQTGNANKYLQTDGTNATWDAVSLSTADITGTLAVANGGTGVTTSTGTGAVVLSNSPTLVTPALGTPASGTATNLTGLPISTGVSGLGTGVATFLGTPSSANLASAVTDETGSGALVFANSPTLVTPALGTPSSATLTNATGLPISTGVSGLGTGVATFLATPSSANLASAVSDETGSGALVFATSPTLVTPALGTPSALVGTNITGTASGLTAGNVTTNANLTGAVTSVGNATSLGSFSSANLLSALTDETGTGVVVFSTSPTLVTPILGTPTSATLTNATGLPLTTGVTGQLPIANGGTGTATPSIVAGSNVTVTGTWPNQTIASSSSGGVSYTAVKTANYTAANNDGVLTNTTGGAFTVTLPSTPSVGNIVLVIDSLSQWGTNNLTIDPTASIKIAGNTAGDTLVCDITGATVTLVYTGATYGWNVAAQVGGNGGTAVTLTGTQTLTNKTLTAPTVTGVVVSDGTANGVTYLNGSKVLTSGSALVFDGTNLGVGVTPSAWSLGKALEIGTAVGNAVWGVGSSNMNLTSNIYFNSGYKFAGTGFGGTLSMASGGVSIASTTASGTAGAAASFTDILAVSLGNSVALQGATVKTGTGITFPATQSASSDANTLDDYEEGTWTPSLGGTTTYNGQTGTYTKIGNVVHIRGNLHINSIGTGSATTISGLPFTASGDDAISFSYFDVDVNVYWINLYTQTSGTNLLNRGQTALDGVVNSGLSLYASGKQVVFSGMYRV